MPAGEGSVQVVYENVRNVAVTHLEFTPVVRNMPLVSIGDVFTGNI